MRFAIEAGRSTHDLATEHSIRGVPVGADEVIRDGGAAVRERLAAKGLEPCQIGAFGINLIRPTAEGRAQVEGAIDESGPSGCPIVVIPGGSYHESIFGGFDRRNFTGEALLAAAKTLAPLVLRAADAGAVLSIEPYIKSAVHSPEAFVELIDRTATAATRPVADIARTLRLNLDVTNYYDLRDLIDPTPLVRSIVPTYAGHVGLIHIKEIGLDEGFHIHAGLKPITDGPTDWGLVLELAATVADEGCWVLLEHLLSEDEARKSIAHLRYVADRAGVTLA